MDFEGTKQYYERLTEEDLCQCEYCRTYVRAVRTALPRLAVYLERLGVDYVDLLYIHQPAGNWLAG